MKTLSDLVLDRERCLALLEAGFPQDTALGWHLRQTRHTCEAYYEVGAGNATRKSYDCAAPTLEEVMAALPRHVRNGERGYKRLALVVRDGMIGYAPKSLPRPRTDLCIYPPEDAGRLTVAAAADLYLALVRAGHITPEASGANTPTP